MEMQRQVYDGTEWVSAGEPVEIPTVDIPVAGSVLRDGELVETTPGFLRMPTYAVVAAMTGAERFV